MNIYLIAVEPSADQLGADLAGELRVLDPNIVVSGIGGARMADAGIASAVNTSGLAILGITEALMRLPLVYRKIAEASADIEASQPDMVVMIDSYGFMVRLAERLRKHGFEKTLVKYVAPQVWATRPSRAKRLARLFDHLLTLHPFEADWFTPLGLPTQHVGNAVFDTDYKSGDPNALRQKYDLGDRPILSVFFGSRPSEIKRLAKPFSATVQALKEQIPDLAILSPVSASVAEDVGAAAGSDPSMNDIILLPEDSKLDVMACSTAALACSGTVTTQLACAGVPTVVAYRMSWLTSVLVGMMLNSKYISMVNIDAKAFLMPEFVQKSVTVDNLVKAVSPYLIDTKKRAAASDALILQTNLMRGSKTQSASAQAAQAIVELLQAP
jgi:lipid-A-disaccharide synthase